MKNLVRWVVCWLSLAAIVSARADIELFPLAADTEVPPLGSKQGYGIIRLHLSGVAPSLEVRGLIGGNATPPREIGQRKYRNPEKLLLGGLSDGLYVLPLRAGGFQVTSVNVPSFSLPFRLDVSENPRWFFRIEQGKASYIGDLAIAPERRTDTVNIQLRNRLATDLELLNDAVTLLPGSPPFVSGYSLRDNFLMQLEEAKQ